MGMTVMELLEQTIDDLNRIEIPVALADRIARPLCGVVANLQAIHEALEEPKEEPKEGDADGV